MTRALTLEKKSRFSPPATSTFCIDGCRPGPLDLLLTCVTIDCQRHLPHVGEERHANADFTALWDKELHVTDGTASE